MWAYLGDHARAAAEVEDVTGATSERLRRNDFTKAARILSVCSCAVSSASNQAGAERERRHEAHATGEVQYLMRAYAAGMLRGPEEREFLLHDADFAALRPRPDFQLLMMDLGFPTPEPFASRRLSFFNKDAARFLTRVPLRSTQWTKGRPSRIKWEGEDHDEREGSRPTTCCAGPGRATRGPWRTCSTATGAGCGTWSASASTAASRAASTPPTCSRRPTSRPTSGSPTYLREPAMPFFLWLRLVTGQKLIDLHRHHLGAKMRDAGLEVSLHRGAPAAGQLGLAGRAAAGPAHLADPRGAAGRDAAAAAGGPQPDGPDRPRGPGPAPLRGAEQRARRPRSSAWRRRRPATATSAP